MKREEGKHFRKIHARMQAHLDVLKQGDAYRKLSPHEKFLLARDKGKWEETPSMPLAALFGDIETIKTLISDDRLQQFNTGAKNGTCTTGAGPRPRVETNTLQKYTDHAAYTGVTTPAP